MKVLSAKHRHMLEVERGISPEVIAARGYYTETDPANLRALGFAPYQCLPGLVIPETTTAGVQVGWKLRPDNPRRDAKTGKVIKYENPAGARHQIDVPPGVVAFLRNPSIPLYITEGSPKADAAWSRGLACVSLGGVWAFLRERLVIPDLDDIDLDGRLVLIAFDSDVMRKPSVREALERLAAAVERRGAIVHAVYLPDGPNGEKVGLDDFFAAGGTVAELEALTRPWSATPPPLLPDPDDPVEEAARYRRERDEARRAIGTLVQVCLNPNLKATEKVAIVATFGLVQAKRDRGEVDPDGTVRLSAAEIANDWRPDPKKGEHVAPFNPKDGSKPRMSRDKVRPLLNTLTKDRGLLPASPRPTVRHRDGASFQDTEWAIVPPASLDAFLIPAAGWCPEEITPRKPRSLPCPHCNEVHKVERIDVCQGCGSIRERKIIDPPDRAGAELDMSPESTSEKLAEVRTPPVVSASPAPPPLSLVRKTIGGAAPVEPPYLSAAFAPPAPPDNYTRLDHRRPAP